jgi:hypothetical protein
MPTEKKRNSFDFMMVIHMYICFREEKILHETRDWKIKRKVRSRPQQAARAQRGSG